MKVLLVLPVSIFLSSFASAADVVFRDETVGIGYGFSAKADGFEYSALTHFRKVSGLSVTLDAVEKSGVYVPINTNISLQNVNDDTHPTDAKYPQGSVGWSLDSPDVYRPTYTFTVFAGGKFYYPDEQSYQISLSVDGREYGPVVTDPQSNWSPTYFNAVPFAESSRLTIVLSPLPLSPLPECSSTEKSTVLLSGACKLSVSENPVPEGGSVPENPSPENPVVENSSPENPVAENPSPENPVPENPAPENPVPENQQRQGDEA
ncbi:MULTISPECIES: hypothetical protein [unclassified Endozoicomonas]|uniref:hypothetical protein n=1 Tax=unclassified Endozoicomonas TaxID=2644528 RepID=UPI002149583E|nr:MULTISPECIES: hypothetical protein [unclassified Endozoicomonas]